MKLNLPYINYLLDIIKDIEESLNKVSKNNFMHNKDKREANIRRILIISDVVKNVSGNLKDRHPEIEWIKFEQIKDLLKHQYFGIDINAVWDVLKEDIPILKKELIKISQMERGV